MIDSRLLLMIFKLLLKYYYGRNPCLLLVVFVILTPKLNKTFFAVTFRKGEQSYSYICII